MTRTSEHTLNYPYRVAVTQTVLVFFVQDPTEEVGSAAAAVEVAAAEPDTGIIGPEEPDAAIPDGATVDAGAEAPVAEAATLTAVAVAELEATPPVPAAARTDEIEVQAGFLERFSS